MNFFSIIIPAYNAEKSIEKTIGSVTNQKYRDIEILVINDGSTDQTLDKIQRICHKDNRVQLINIKKNKGVSNARNIGIKKSKSAYILFLDSDDSLVKGSLDKFHKIIKKEKKEIEIIVADYESQRNIRTKIKKKFDFKINTKNKRLVECITDIDSFSSVCWRFIINRNFLLQKKITFLENVNMNEDHLFVCSLLINCKDFVITKELLYSYGQNLNSITNKIMYEPKFIDVLGYLKIAIGFSNILSNPKLSHNIIEKKFIIARLNATFISFCNSLLYQEAKNIKLINNYFIKNKKIIKNLNYSSKNFYNLCLKKDINHYLDYFHQQIYSQIIPNKNIIIYCKSFLGVGVSLLLNNKEKIVGIIDGNKSYHNKKIYKINIYSINYLKKLNYKNHQNYQIIICHPYKNVQNKIYKDIKKIGKSFNVTIFNIKY